MNTVLVAGIEGTKNIVHLEKKYKWWFLRRIGFILKRIIGTLPCCALGAQIPPPLIFSFSFFLILAPAGGYNPVGT